MLQNQRTLIAALAFSLLVPLLGYVYLGALYAVLFLVGYLGGFALWMATPHQVPWQSIKLPYWLTMASFLFLHKVEENRMAFFASVASQITGDPVPNITVGLIVALLILPLGAWLMVPWFVKRVHPFGYYLAYSFFASMGFTELAHFVLPFLTNDTYGYFPGMASAILLAPLGWWGLRRLRS